MAITRSMSGATKKIHKVPHKVRHKVPDKAGKWVPRTIVHDAFSVFMMKDYLKRYYETHPYPTTPILPKEIERSGYLEWSGMSDIDKDVWIKYTKERMAEGMSLGRIREECSATYERH